MHKKAILQDIKLPVLCCESGIYIRQRIKVPLELIHHLTFDRNKVFGIWVAKTIK